MDECNENLKSILIQLADESGYAVFSISNGKFTFANSTFLKIFGYTKEELINKMEFSTLIHPEWRDYVIKGLDEHERMSCSFKANRKDGEEFTVTLISKRYRDNDDYTITGFLLNPSRESEYLKQLKETRILLETFLNSVGDIIFLLDEDGNFVFSNSPRDLVEFDPDELIGKNISDILPEEILEKFKKAFLSNKTGKTENYEVEVLLSGEEKRFHVKQSPFFVGNSFKGVVLVIHDITEIRRTFKKLEISERRYRSLFENVPVGFYTTTPDGRIVNFNPQASKIFGYTKEELKHKNAIDLYLNKEERKAWVKEIIEKGAVEKETRFVRKDGRIVWIKNTARVIRTSEGEIFIEGSIQDITELKTLEKFLRDSLEKMKRLFDSIVIALSTTVEVRDPYTAGHQRRVTKLAIEIAKEMNLNESVDLIRIAGLLHDIGKIAIPSDILTKPTKLTDIEYMLVKEHPVVGYEILKKVEFPWSVAEVILQHHERINGSGYPMGLRKNEILLEARILSVADVVEAISSHRPYRPALGIEVALIEIRRNSGILYDPDVVRACLKVFNTGFKFED